MQVYARSLIAFAVSLYAVEASAIVQGFDPATAPPVIPVNEQPTQVWKLVGKVTNPQGATASGVQIAPQWIIGAAHVNAVNNVFSNPYGTSTLQWCEVKPSTDIELCRLAAPIPVPGTDPFPPLSSVPLDVVNAKQLYGQAMRDFGAILGVGFSTGSARAVWVAFDGLPYASSFSVGGDSADKVLIEDPSGVLATYRDTAKPVPYTANGDSGGGLFWFSPSGAPSLLGTFSNANTLISSASVYSSDVISWVQQKLQEQGAAPVATKTFTAQSEGSGFAAPRLSSKPVTLASSTTHTKVSWMAPTALSLDSRPITDYLITLAKGGQVERTIVRSSAARYIEWNDLAVATPYIVCVTPRNATGAGSGAHGAYLSTSAGAVISTTSCNKFISGAPPAVSSYSSNWTVNPDSTRTLKASWTAPVFNSIANYKVLLRIEESNGTSNTTTHYSTTPSITFPSLPSNKRICYSALPISSAGVEAETATEVCPN